MNRKKGTIIISTEESSSRRLTVYIYDNPLMLRMQSSKINNALHLRLRFGGWKEITLVY